MIYKAVINEQKKEEFFAYLKELNVPAKNAIFTVSRGNVLLYDIVLDNENTNEARNIWHMLSDKIPYFL